MVSGGRPEGAGEVAQGSQAMGLTSHGFNLCGVFDDISANVHIIGPLMKGVVLRSLEFNDADIKEPQTNAEEKLQEMDFGLAKTNELVTFVGGSGGDGGEDEEPWTNDWEADTPSATAPLVDGIDNDGFIPIGSDPASLEFQKEYRDVVEGSQRATNSSTTGSAPPPKDNIDGDLGAWCPGFQQHKKELTQGHRRDREERPRTGD
ncbi:uncharacterized protein CCOS01_16453 [Colletotrichum costaricense]|uniref:Uncharacterized protein n=1 Tax=Colletotrichum costaricense TaxID=1209916 RepID=A0AAI9YG39_9PEZI|nr:uncharacterized protein CCOS01_16453 [Colletotrichum costaricense]KAK1506594.1 hypothetical protein CCOS01_16453 [Colletotrichum costaricense]